jgi:hypothetical protein
VDEQLRAKPDDVLTLLRAGRLTADRVAMAAYLGDERALATGVQPWVVPDADDEQIRTTNPMYRFLRRGVLSRRERVWLACLLAERVVQRGWPGHLGLQRAISTARRWCQGEVTPQEALEAAGQVERERQALPEVTDPEDARDEAVHAATNAAQAAAARCYEQLAGAYWYPGHYAQQAARTALDGELPQETLETLTAQIASLVALHSQVAALGSVSQSQRPSAPERTRSR